MVIIIHSQVHFATLLWCLKRLLVLYRFIARQSFFKTQMAWVSLSQKPSKFTITRGPARTE